MRILITILSIFVLIGCQNKEEVTQVQEPVVVPELPTIPQAEFQQFIQAVDEIDIQFLEKGFSMNAQGNGAKAELSKSIIPQVMPKTACTEVAYFFVKGQGEQLAHIGAFYGDGCAYYIFYENSRPKYICGMSQYGAGYLNKFLKGVQTSPQ